MFQSQPMTTSAQSHSMPSPLTPSKQSFVDEFGVPQDDGARPVFQASLYLLKEVVREAAVLQRNALFKLLQQGNGERRLLLESVRQQQAPTTLAITKLVSGQSSFLGSHLCHLRQFAGQQVCHSASNTGGKSDIERQFHPRT